jgi:hypothetical protein
MLQTVRFSPSPRLAPSASSTPSVTQAKNVQRQGFSPAYLDLLNRRFLKAKQTGATEFLRLLPIMAKLAEDDASVLRNIESTESKEAIRSFEETYRDLSRKPDISEAERALLTSYIEGIPTSQEVATPLAEKFSTLVAEIRAYIESIKTKA